MEVLVSEIFSRFSDSALLQEHLGGDCSITGIQSVESCRPGDLVFVENKKFVDEALKGKPSAMVVTKEIAEKFLASSDVTVLIASNVRLAHAIIKQEFANRNYSDDQWERVHPSAVIHDSVSIPQSTFVSPNVVVEKDVEIGENCRLLSGVVIETGAEMGDGCIIHPNAVISYNCVLGKSVEVGASSIIGSEGFGYATDEDHKCFKIPQTGRVILEDNVQIGSGNCIDRAAYGDTRIGAGTKTDNLCHFGHGVQIGKDCMLTAMFCVAGSTTVGDRVMSSGQTGILDHLNIADDVVLLHRAGVTKDITEPGMYAGGPLQPLSQYMKNFAYMKKLAELNKRVKDLENKISEDKSVD